MGSIRPTQARKYIPTFEPSHKYVDNISVLNPRFFRATEWNGRIMLSADYNELAVEPSVVNEWMEKWAELILASA